ncbi:MAG: carbon starvation protein A [Synergistaceae bacterium]|nr:carbon starvation protein A [Synergistaceae bacterium]
MLAWLFGIAILFFLISYWAYGSFMAKVYGLSNDNKTPAEAMYDGVDYVPAHPAVLLGHHFSSIAGAGPIVGPITAASLFGWLPAYIWCLIGSAFLGGPHDMGGLVGSMRHEGKSIGEIVARWIGKRGKFLFLCFSILTLFLIVAVFLQLSADSFAADPAVAFSATLYMFLAVLFGFLLYRKNFSLLLMTVIAVPIILYACWFGNSQAWIARLFTLSSNARLELHQFVPAAPETISEFNFELLKEKYPAAFAGIDSFEEIRANDEAMKRVSDAIVPESNEAQFTEAKSSDEVISNVATYPEYLQTKADLKNQNMERWRWILVVYIFLASILPVWLLLQPRDYLASYFLYFAIIIGSIGMVMGRDSLEIKLPMFKGFYAGGDNYIWPMLFIIIACGAISGFHALVGSGTSSKQIRKEKDSIIVGYGGMLLEGLVAVIAIGTVMIAGGMLGNPNNTYAEGFGRFASLIGIDPKVGKSLGLLALNSFLLTSLDTATRLGRYQIQEITGNRIDRYTATIITIVASMALVMSKTTNPAGQIIPTWSAIWPMFGSANQLIAGLSLLALAVWVKKGLKKNNAFLMYPMWFMLVTTITALLFMVKSSFIGVANPNFLLGGMAVILLVLAVLMAMESFTALKKEI